MSAWADAVRTEWEALTGERLGLPAFWPISVRETQPRWRAAGRRVCRGEGIQRTVIRSSKATVLRSRCSAAAAHADT